MNVSEGVYILLHERRDHGCVRVRGSAQSRAPILASSTLCHHPEVMCRPSVGTTPHPEGRPSLNYRLVRRVVRDFRQTASCCSREVLNLALRYRGKNGKTQFEANLRPFIACAHPKLSKDE